MTHSNIMEILGSRPVIGDYISIAIADGWSKLEVTEALNKHLENTTGVNCWSRITGLINEYLSEFGKVTAEDPDFKANPKGGCPNFIRNRKPVIYKGQRYESIIDAARKTGITKDKMRYALLKGAAQYV